MGIFLSKFHQFFHGCHRHRLSAGHHPVVFPVRCDAPPGWDHPAAPAPAVTGCFTCMVHLDHLGFTSGGEGGVLLWRLHTSFWGSSPWWTGRTLQRSPCYLLGILGCLDPREPSIFLLQGAHFSLLCSPPKQGVKAEKLGPSRTVPLPCPREMEVKVPKRDGKEWRQSGAEQWREWPEQPP